MELVEIKPFDIPKETVPLCNDHQEIENSAETMVVNSPEGYEKGAKALAVIKHAKKKVLTALKAQKQNAHAVHSTICEYESKLTAPLDHAEDCLKNKMSDWLINQKDKEEEALAKGETFLSVIPDTPNIAVREVYKAYVTDESKIPKQFWSVDKKKLADFAKQNKGLIKIEGVEIVKGMTIVNNS